MKTKLCIASLLSFLILYGDCNVSQNFNDEKVVSCYLHFLCDLHETDPVYQLVEESTDKVKVKFWEIMKEVYDAIDGQSREDFELYKVTICNYTEEGRKASVNEFASLGFEYGLAACVNPYSKLCKEGNDFIMRAAAYVKGITESDECK
ncbi:hypothetical protein AVEN_102067-1 [Araneus ventricosus]|uniref:DUF19 domain-containing protein n=1 Tax=Araneus ventricosus TaxID=182803 RepID=A0A4Y2MVF3_ARAVE|nr:hypothetical protein AVEN_102067-1 [Araneus ventricosus]